VTPHKLYIEPLCIDVREVTVYLSDAHEIDLVRAIVRFRGFEVVVYVHADIPTDDQNTIVVCPDGGSCNERRLNTILIRTCIEEFVTLLAHNIGFYPLLTKPFALYGSPGEKSQKQLAREMQDLILTTIRVRVEFQ
jgi:hypothetical protein